MKRPIFSSMLPLCAVLVVGCGGSPGHHGSSETCDTGTTSCNGYCTNVNVDVNNCGACGVMCPQNESCVNGLCIAGGGCSAGLSPCGSACVDTQTDFNNCGGCGVACTSGQSCVSGQCSGGSNSNQGGGTCVEAIQCLNGCSSSDNACQQDCVDNTSSTGQQQLQALFDCIDAQCPNGDSSCLNQVQMQGGACYDALATCNGGGGGGGGGTGSGTCGDYLDCQNACTDATCEQGCYSATDATGQQLVDDLISCLFDDACPDTAGGVCASNSAACNQCLDEAQMDGGACAAELTACNQE